MIEHSEEAKRWLRNYNGSIDATALLLAFDAGQRGALADAGHGFLRGAHAGIEPVLNETAGKILMRRAERIGVTETGTEPISEAIPARQITN